MRGIGLEDENKDFKREFKLVSNEETILDQSSKVSEKDADKENMSVNEMEVNEFN